jgi:hypothetical protein
MDATASNFSNRSNAKRAAEKMIAKGTAPDSTTQSCGLCGRKERVCRRDGGLGGRSGVRSRRVVPSPPTASRRAFLCVATAKVKAACARIRVRPGPVDFPI